MKDLEDLGVGEQLEERFEVDPGRQGVDRRDVVLSADLHQAEFRPVGVVAHEFRVDRDEVGLLVAAAECGKRLRIGDQSHWLAV